MAMELVKISVPPSTRYTLKVEAAKQGITMAELIDRLVADAFKNGHKPNNG